MNITFESILVDSPSVPQGSREKRRKNAMAVIVLKVFINELLDFPLKFFDVAKTVFDYL